MSPTPPSASFAPLIDAALGRADDAVAGAAFACAPTATRWWCIGDPQGSFAHFATAIARHGLLGDDGLLAEDVGLVSLGDHFDYGGAADVDVAGTAARGREGQRILAWLAAHPRSRVRILLGNHDAVRVMEFAHFDDDVFTRARVDSHDATGREREFRERYGVPSPGCVQRDFCTWTTAQRTQVQRLLLAGRYDLGLAAVDDERPVLLTHAGVTTRELALLGLPDDVAPATVAGHLNALLARAVAAAAPAWTTQPTTPLVLEPVHVAGTTGEEAGGLLAHRPAPASADPWSWDTTRPRRFRLDALPRHFDQLVGHTSGKILCREFTTRAAAVAPHGRVTTLFLRDDEATFAPGPASPGHGATRVTFADAGLHHAAGQIELARVTSIQAEEEGVAG